MKALRDQNFKLDSSKESIVKPRTKARVKRVKRLKGVLQIPAAACEGKRRWHVAVTSFRSAMQRMSETYEVGDKKNDTTSKANKRLSGE